MIAFLTLARHQRFALRARRRCFVRASRASSVGASRASSSLSALRALKHDQVTLVICSWSFLPYGGEPGSPRRRPRRWVGYMQCARVSEERQAVYTPILVWNHVSSRPINHMVCVCMLPPSPRSLALALCLLSLPPVMWF